MRSYDPFRAFLAIPKPDGKLTKDGIRRVFEALDMEYTERAKRRRLKTPKGKASNDVSEVYSPPRVTEVAEATGLRTCRLGSRNSVTPSS